MDFRKYHHKAHMAAYKDRLLAENAEAELAKTNVQDADIPMGDYTTTKPTFHFPERAWAEVSLAPGDQAKLDGVWMWHYYRKRKNEKF
ncbi:hypothetical protein Landi51_04088 [Colletotrichum acutatum]